MREAFALVSGKSTGAAERRNEAVVQSAVSKPVEGKTLIVIAHSLSTVTDSDQILVVSQGRIEAPGKHDALLGESPLYRRLWETHVGARDEVREIS